jgi:Flp pilus assembly protein CpaB
VCRCSGDLTRLAPDRAIRTADRQKIANLRISTALDAQQILNLSDNVSSSDERIMGNVVKSGMRAVTIHTEGRSSAFVPWRPAG